MAGKLPFSLFSCGLLQPVVMPVHCGADRPFFPSITMEPVTRSDSETQAAESHIRPMTMCDLEQVVAIERLCHDHPWSAELFQRELANPISTIDLFWFDKKLAGYLCSWMVGDELEILNVATAPAFRRRGVAAALMRHVFARVHRQGLDSAFLEVRVGNTGAIDLYHKFGFAVVARRSRYYADGEDALLMQWHK
jgi:ribosomal-protein-alanine N-acetyltransferase